MKPAFALFTVLSLGTAPFQCANDPDPDERLEDTPPEALFNLAEQFRQHNPATLRESLLASLKNRPFVTEVLSGGAGNTSTQLRMTNVYSSQQ